jgi:hypothetical protein
MLSEQAAGRLLSDAVDWPAGAPDPVSSLFKQDLRTQLCWREGPARDLPFTPIPKASRAGHRARGTPHAQKAICYRGARQGRGRAATGLPAPSAQKTCRPADVEEPERHAATLAVGSAGGPDLGGRERHRGQRPQTAARRTARQVQGGGRKAATRVGTPGSAFSTPSCDVSKSHRIRIPRSPWGISDCRACLQGWH